MIVTDLYLKRPRLDVDDVGLPRTEAAWKSVIKQAGFEIVVSEDHTDALRTFIVQLAKTAGGLVPSVVFSAEGPVEFRHE